MDRAPQKTFEDYAFIAPYVAMLALSIGVSLVIAAPLSVSVVPSRRRLGVAETLMTGLSAPHEARALLK